MGPFVRAISAAFGICCLFAAGPAVAQKDKSGDTTLLLTKAVTFQQAFCGLTNDAIWLIVYAFFFAKVQEGRVLFLQAVWLRELPVPHTLPCSACTQTHRKRTQLTVESE